MNEKYCLTINKKGIRKLQNKINKRMENNMERDRRKK